MLKRSRGLTRAAVVSLVCVTGGLAQGSPNARPQRLVLLALDLNGDGVLSANEIEAAPTSLATLDHNKDGSVSADELQPRPENAGAKPEELVVQLMHFDKNSDGALTADELPARLAAMLQRGDTNHDGRLTPDEIRAMAEQQGMPAGTALERRTAFMRNDPLLSALDLDHDGALSASEMAVAAQSLRTLDKNGDGILDANEMRPRQQTPAERVDHLLSEWDTNKDGKLSQAEAPDRLQQHFSAIDTTRDGFLDRNELLQYFASQNAENNDRRGGQGDTKAPMGDRH